MTVCVGHPCDACKTCISGHCCRRDNGSYSLPVEGSWVPYVGEIGVRNTDGERIECHACGEWFQSLAKHIWARHDLTVDEYRALFGLSTFGLIAPGLRRRLSAAGEQHGERLGASGARPTPEQYAARRVTREGRANIAKSITVEQHRKAGLSVSAEAHRRAGQKGGLARGAQLREVPGMAKAHAAARDARMTEEQKERRRENMRRVRLMSPVTASRKDGK